MLLLLLVQLFTQLDSLPAVDSTGFDTTDIVLFGGENLTYFTQEEKVIITNSAWVRYREMNLLADSIEYDTKDHILSAFAKPIVDTTISSESSATKISYVFFQNVTTKESIIGLELNYNVDTRKGMMRKASTEITNGFFRGEEIWLVKERTLNVNQGHYTTCNRYPPHYHFFGSKVRVLMDDMVITQPIILKIGNIPIIAAPFWFFPIGKNRKSGLSPFKVGQSNTEGFYAKNISYYWVINDYADMTFSLDFMMKKGFYPKVEGIYIVDPYARGQILGTFIREFGTKVNRYSINAKHGSDFLFGTDLEAYVDYQTDERLISDYAEERIEWLKKELYSYGQLSRSFRRIGRGSFYVQHRRNFADKTTEITLPRLSIGFYSRPIFRSWNISPGISFANNLHIISDSLGDSLKTETRSASLGLGIAPPQLPFGPLDVSQSFGYSETKDYTRSNTQMQLTDSRRNLSSSSGLGTSQKLFQSINIYENISFNENIQFGDTNIYQSRYSFSTGSNMTLYRIFGIEIFGLHGILHQATPNISYSVQPAVRQKGFFGVPRFDTLPVSSGLSFGLSNLFQAKIGEDKIKRDLSYINLGSSYDFINRKITPIFANADFFILQSTKFNLNANVGTVFDVSTRDFTDYSTNTNFSYSFSRYDTATNVQSGLSLNLNHFWDPRSNMISIILAFSPRGWQFNITTGSDLRKPWPPADINIGIIKDLHCWELLFTGSGMGTTWRYDFKFRIKQIPEINVGKGIFNFILP